MKLAETVTFGGSGLDRAGEVRNDPHEVGALWAAPDARVVPIWRGKPCFSADRRMLTWLPTDHPVIASATETILLGRDGGAGRFAADVSGWEPEDIPESLGAFFDPSMQTHPALGEAHVFAELRGAMTLITPRDAELAATARAVFSWHSTHPFCARCGAASEVAMAGWQRVCPACGAHHFPRTDPVVIMLITLGNDVLVGRSPGWPDAMYSLLAGFVEPGETIEAAVRRETMEEAGVPVGPVHYLASQPWPFPSSLMIGCHGLAKARKITLDPVELDDARWVSREEMAAVFSGEREDMWPARPGSIANFLLGHWLADRLD
ncbi:MAG: NAD(+) diphosphatase [Pseudomonadota bacterium]